MNKYKAVNNPVGNDITGQTLVGATLGDLDTTYDASKVTTTTATDSATINRGLVYEQETINYQKPLLRTPHTTATVDVATGIVTVNITELRPFLRESEVPVLLPGGVVYEVTIYTIGYMALATGARTGAGSLQLTAPLTEMGNLLIVETRVQSGSPVDCFPATMYLGDPSPMNKEPFVFIGSESFETSVGGVFENGKTVLHIKVNGDRGISKITTDIPGVPNPLAVLRSTNPSALMYSVVIPYGGYTVSNTNKITVEYADIGDAALKTYDMAVTAVKRDTNLPIPQHQSKVTPIPKSFDTNHGFFEMEGNDIFYVLGDKVKSTREGDLFTLTHAPNPNSKVQLIKTADKIYVAYISGHNLYLDVSNTLSGESVTTVQQSTEIVRMTGNLPYVFGVDRFGSGEDLDFGIGFSNTAGIIVYKVQGYYKYRVITNNVGVEQALDDALTGSSPLTVSSGRGRQGYDYLLAAAGGKILTFNNDASSYTMGEAASGLVSVLGYEGTPGARMLEVNLMQGDTTLYTPLKPFGYNISDKVAHAIITDPTSPVMIVTTNGGNNVYKIY